MLIASSLISIPGWDRLVDHDVVSRQLSISSDSKLLDDDVREEANVIMRPKRPPRPKSEAYLWRGKQDLETILGVWGMFSQSLS